MITDPGDGVCVSAADVKEFLSKVWEVVLGLGGLLVVCVVVSEVSDVRYFCIVSLFGGHWLEFDFKLSLDSVRRVFAGMLFMCGVAALVYSYHYLGSWEEV